MIAPAQIEPVNPGRGVKGEGKGEELKEDSEADAGAPLQEAAKRKGNEENRDKDRDRRHRSLGISQGQHSLGEKDSREKRAGTSLVEGAAHAVENAVGAGPFPGNLGVTLRHIMLISS